jgi:Leucine-rich repeat (LRR) protein
MLFGMRGRVVWCVLLFATILIIGGLYLVPILLDCAQPYIRANHEKPEKKAPDAELMSRPGVAAIWKLGGRVTVDESASGKPIVGVYLLSTTASDSDLSVLANWTSLRKLDLSGTKISDVGLEHLSSLKELETLYLSFTTIKGSGLKSVTGLPHLRVLDLSKTSLTDSALEHLKEMQTLEILSLIDVPITDNGLEHIAGLTRLRHLNLTGTQVTDAGLPHLYGLAELENLNLSDAPVTQAGCAKLQQKLPRVKISTRS